MKKAVLIQQSGATVPPSRNIFNLNLVLQFNLQTDGLSIAFRGKTNKQTDKPTTDIATHRQNLIWGRFSEVIKRED